MFDKIRERFKDYKPSEIKEEEGIRASVLIPLIEKDKEIYIILIKRTDNLKIHRGEISFPGGVWEEKDENPLRTALRECYEEIGLREKDVETIGMIDEEKTTTGFIIRPYVGIIPYPYNFVLNKEEVDHIIYLPLSYLKGLSLDELPSFLFNGERIWGATARILKKFIKIVD